MADPKDNAALGPRRYDRDGIAIAVCNGCPARRVNDFHYFYCREQGDQSKPDFDAYNGGLHRVYHGPDCGLPLVGDFANAD